MKYLLIIYGALFFGCQSPSVHQKNEAASGTSKLITPEWAKNASMYEVNIRQFTEEGTFEAFQEHIPRLKEMGIDILWFMPIHPISEARRKGSLGSYYAVSDFRSVNPHFGTMEDFEETVRQAHDLDMKVLIDWVPHHTGWDHVWISNHPEYYSKDEEGNIIDPINEETGEPWGWTDVAELKLDNAEMRSSIIDDMKFWLNEKNIDGFRVDHAHGVPDEYWDEVSTELAKLDRPVFMLAEGEETWLRNDSNFVATYAWGFHHAMNEIASDHVDVNVIDTLLSLDRSRYSYGYHLYFTSNHDENSWSGTTKERLGNGDKAFAVLACTIDGMPLVYSGQEAPLEKRLEFFEKDPIEWGEYAYADFYKTLLNLKDRNKALWNGEFGGLSERVNRSDDVYAYKREKYGDRFYAILNLSDKVQETTLFDSVDGLTDVFTGNMVAMEAGDPITLGPWEFLVLSNR
jgi:glycosidase